jgi:hypothetical protein
MNVFEKLTVLIKISELKNTLNIYAYLIFIEHSNIKLAKSKFEKYYLCNHIYTNNFKYRNT